MADNKSELDATINVLKQQRDALQLKIHLAEMEAKAEYERLSGKLDELSAQYEPVQDALEESAGNVFAALLLAAGELKTGIERVRGAIVKED